MGRDSNKREREIEQSERAILVLCVAIFVAFLTPGLLDWMAAEYGWFEESPEDRKAGFHCLDSWDGIHFQFRNEVVEGMIDPASFEHIATRVTPNREGWHNIQMGSIRSSSKMFGGSCSCGSRAALRSLADPAPGCCSSIGQAGGGNGAAGFLPYKREFLSAERLPRDPKPPWPRRKDSVSGKPLLDS